MAEASSAEDSGAKQTVRLVIDADLEGERADVALGKGIAGLSRRAARKLGLAGHLKIDGRRCPPSQKVKAGENLELLLPEAAPNHGAESHSLTVLCETAEFIYVSKPPAVHTTALVPGQADCLSSQIVDQFPECEGASLDPREGGAVHRLDFDTSGVVAFARSPEVWTRARAAFDAAKVRKRYLAICRHQPEEAWPPPMPEGALMGWFGPGPEGGPQIELPPEDGAREIDCACLSLRAPLGRGPEKRLAAVRLDGQSATTLVWPRRHVADGLACELELVTGRRHQARVHLSWAGLSIVGDPLYGGPVLDALGQSETNAGDTYPGLRLHAAWLDLSTAFPSEAPVLAPLLPGFL